ncbi:cell division topological specificity factor MinE [Clostridium frigidicarnis]|uniref:Cell division topological specificity factor n=1 Tax=Clostridium frigidicarnis TaxID=84698 RepID=A0A1I1A1A1_9CLOT|nr:cell division topological specificity factor MinE [Clostridium frigidicarnis]SFB31721.1 cell division topological specificity factor [Clostridium frigidicarnis]
MELFKRITSKNGSKKTAKDRLKLILIHDRGDIPTEVIEKIRCEVLEVISKYVDIDNEDVEIAISRSSEESGATPALIANIPIKNIK